jgi:hypothetical protein
MTSENGPQPKCSHGLDDAKFINAPKPSSPASTRFPPETPSLARGRGVAAPDQYKQCGEKPHDRLDTGHEPDGVGKLPGGGSPQGSGTNGSGALSVVTQRVRVHVG